MMAIYNRFAEAIGNALLNGYTIDDAEYGKDGTELVNLSVSKFVDDAVEYSKVFDIEAMTEETILYDKLERCARFDEILHYGNGEPVLEVAQ